MRLLLVAQDFPPATGGIQTYAEELASRLAVRCEGFGAVAPGGPAAAATDTDRPFRVHRLPGSSDAFPFAALAALPRLARRERPDVAFCVQWHPAGAALLARRLTGFPRRVAIAAHGRELLLTPRGPAGAAVSLARRRVLLSADAHFPVSRYTAGLLQRLGVSAERTIVVHNGANPDGCADASPAERDGWTLLTVGRLVPRKGVDTVLRALPRVLAARPDARYVVAGDGPERGRLEALATSLGVSEHVRFLGRVPDAELRRLYATCDAFVMPSRDTPPDVEGFGIVFLEASACGKPVVGARTGGIPDAIEDGVSGLLVEPDRPDVLAEALIRLAGDPAWAARLGAQGRRRVAEHFTWDRAADTIFKGLEQLACG